MQSGQEPLAEWDKKSWVLMPHPIFLVYTMVLLGGKEWGSYSPESENALSSSHLSSGSRKGSGIHLIVLRPLSLETGLALPALSFHLSRNLFIFHHPGIWERQWALGPSNTLKFGLLLFPFHARSSETSRKCMQSSCVCAFF